MKHSASYVIILCKCNHLFSLTLLMVKTNLLFTLYSRSILSMKIKTKTKRANLNERLDSIAQKNKNDGWSLWLWDLYSRLPSSNKDSRVAKANLLIPSRVETQGKVGWARFRNLRSRLRVSCGWGFLINHGESLNFRSQRHGCFWGFLLIIVDQSLLAV